MTTINDVINMIKDTIDDGELESAKDYLEGFKTALADVEEKQIKKIYAVEFS